MAFYLIIYLSWVYQEINVHFLHADASVQIIHPGTVQYVLKKKVHKIVHELQQYVVVSW